MGLTLNQVNQKLERGPGPLCSALEPEQSGSRVQAINHQPDPALGGAPPKQLPIEYSTAWNGGREETANWPEAVGGSGLNGREEPGVKVLTKPSALGHPPLPFYRPLRLGHSSPRTLASLLFRSASGPLSLLFPHLDPPSPDPSLPSDPGFNGPLQ